MRRSLVLAIAALVGAPPPAAAQPNKEASDEAFKEGKRLIGEGNTRAACVKFEESLTLMDRLGTRLNLAVCYGRLGKLIAARDAFRTAETVAIRDKDTRIKYIREQLALLAPRIPTLTIALAAGLDPTAIEVRRNGEVVPRQRLGTPVPIDPGAHVVSAASPGAQDWSTQIQVSPGSRHTVTIPALGRVAPGSEVDPIAASAVVETDASASSTSSHRTRQLISFGVGGVGLVALGVGTYIALDAYSDWNDLNEGPDGCGDDGCPAELMPAARSARRRSVVGFSLGGAGLAMVVAGASLYAFWARPAGEESAPTSARFAPVLGPDQAGVVWTGEF